ncbi:MAG TPA: choice-of-anchor Q domain-containing protein, partial [Ilumatobacteraceae bacterium]|nr:choice-of-anchor Q domain-containing protein [Ilumatobacteraceae bacterium]
MTLLALAACILLAVGGCGRVVTAPTAEHEVGALAAYTVTNGEDSGTGSLRDVVAAAPPDAVVTFDASVSTVALTSAPITIDKDLTILGPDGGTVTISGSDTVSVFVVTSGGVEAILQNLTITRGRSSSGDGGGVRVDAPVSTEGWSSLTLVDCTVAENLARYSGGGVYVNGRLVMERTTVRDNQAGAKGGGVAFHGSVPSDTGKAAYIRNSTFTGNWGVEGGGFANSGGGATIEFSTFSGNRSGHAIASNPWGGGIHSYNSSTQTRLLGTIVVGNVAAYDGTPTDLFGSSTASSATPFVSLGHNLIGVGGGSASIDTVFTMAGDDVGVTAAEVALQTLADNGGPTQTIALGAGSQAIDAVPESACLDASGAALAVDQRGVTRPQGASCDIGAFEATPVSYVVTSSADDGAGSLRQIVGFAPAGTTITFDPLVSSVILTSGHIVIDKDLTIAGPEDGSVTIDADGKSRVLAVKNGYDVVLSNLTITGGYADHGAGVLLESGASLAGSLTLIDCTVADNHAGGGESVRSDGGGLYVYGTLRMERTTVRGNTGGGWGGGVFHHGTLDPSARIVNSTFTGNVAQGGGAIHNDGGGMTIAFSTITGNQTTLTYGGGGITMYDDGGSDTRLRGTIVVGNTTTAGVANDLHRWFSNTHFVTLGYNLVGTASGFSAAGVFTATGDVAGLTDVGLQPLADNGGPTQTLALGVGSQAIDAVPESACLDTSGAALALDQRGVSRPQNTDCDIGAFELVPAPPPPVTYVVSDGGDDGPGTLRQMLLDAPAGTTITFAPEVTAVNLTSGSLVLDKDVTIAGPEDGTVTIRGDGKTFRVIYIGTAGVQVTLRNLTITEGYTNLSGGGIAVEAWDLGNEPSPSLRLERCSVVGNYAGTGGGGLFVMGDVHIDATTVSGNETGAYGWGGGLSHFGTDVGSSVAYPSAVTIVNSTISGNSAYKGGAISNENGSLRILFSTVTGNTATSSAGGILGYNDAVTRTTIKGTIAVGNTSPAGADDVSEISTTNRFDSRGYNVIGAGSGNVDFTQEFTATGDLTGVAVADAGLLDLGDYGGSTQTHALTSGSVAANRVPLADCTDLAGEPLATDQRGVARPQSSACESGAFEDDGTVATYVLDVTVTPEGSGTVTGAGSYLSGAVVEVTAFPADGWSFDHWSGDLTGVANPATVTMDEDMTVTATFVQDSNTYTLDVTPQGEGYVVVEPSPGPYADGTAVTLEAIPASGWYFQGWTGDITGSTNPVTFEIHASMAVTAIFQPIVGPMVHVALDGDGEGYVTSEPAGIDCHASGASICVASFPRNTKLTLTAVAADDASFLRWTGTVPGIEPDLNVRLREDVTVTAYFVALNGAEVAIDPMGSFRGNTAVVTGSLVCASGSYPLDVSISQVVPVKKGDPVTITAATTVDAVCGQPWTATLVAADGRFVRGEAVV